MASIHAEYLPHSRRHEAVWRNCPKILFKETKPKKTRPDVRTTGTSRTTPRTTRTTRITTGGTPVVPLGVVLVVLGVVLVVLGGCFNKVLLL